MTSAVPWLPGRCAADLGAAHCVCMAVPPHPSLSCPGVLGEQRLSCGRKFFGVFCVVFLQQNASCPRVWGGFAAEDVKGIQYFSFGCLTVKCQKVILSPEGLGALWRNAEMMRRHETRGIVTSEAQESSFALRY